MFRLLLVFGFAATAGVWLDHAIAARPLPCPDEAPPPRPANPTRRPILITATLDKPSVQPGDTIRLTELVSLNRDIRVRSIVHTVYSIGKMDSATGELVNRDPEKPLYTSPEVVFGTNASGGIALGDKYFRYDVTTPREEGLEFELKPHQLGIYLIKAEWSLWRSDQVIESNPVVLTVAPPRDKDGRSIIKPEWLDPITRQYWKPRDGK